jgi:serine/threonine protein kinase
MMLVKSSSTQDVLWRKSLETVHDTLDSLIQSEKCSRKTRLPKLTASPSKLPDSNMPILSAAYRYCDDILLRASQTEVIPPPKNMSSSVVARSGREAKSDRLRNHIRAAASLETEFLCAEVLSLTKRIPFSEFDSNNMSALSCGSNRGVYCYRWKSSIVAVKVLNNLSTPEAENNFKNELVILQSLRHPQIISLLGVACDVPGTQKQSVGLVMEFMSRGSMYDYLRKVDSGEEKSFTLVQKLKILSDASSALKFLHDSEYLHNNISSKSILLDSDCRAKLSGLECVIGNGKLNTNTECIFTIASLTAPEVLLGGANTTASDIYSFGVMLWELLTGQIPFENLSAIEIIKLVGKNGKKLEIPTQSILNPDAILKLLDRCFSSFDKRPSSIEIHSEITIELNVEEKKLADTPESFLCPITCCIMTDPVVAADGHSYDRHAIKEWLILSNGNRSPKTNVELAHSNLTPNHTLRSTIDEYLKNNLTRP